MLAGLGGPSLGRNAANPVAGLAGIDLGTNVHCSEHICKRDRTLNRNQMGSLIRSDLYRYCGRMDWRAALYAFCRIPGFRFTFFLRKTSYHCERSGFFHRAAFWISKLILNHYQFKYGFQIPYTTKLGRGLYIGHHGSVIVNSGAVLGDNVNLSPGVVIGQANRGKRAGLPVIGNRVWIGSNAVIVGAVSIGDDAVIGPGAYVSFDVPGKAVLIGNPAQIKSYAGSEHYVCNIAPESDLMNCGVVSGAGKTVSE